MKEKKRNRGKRPPPCQLLLAVNGNPLRLAGMIAGWTYGKHQVSTAIPGLELHRWESPTEPHSYMFPPIFA